MEYDDEMLREINDHADLVAYAKNVFDLERKGNDYFTNCPFHVDKTPSLSFTPEKNSYYCFSCGRSGKMIGFLMEFEDLSFEDAVEKAASLAHVDLSNMCQSRTIQFLKRWRETLKGQKKPEPFVHPVLPASEYEKFTAQPVQEWLDEGIEQSVMDLFGVRVDEIGNRIVYPVYDLNRNLINIKGRTRYENYKKLKLPKYINYHKVGVLDYFQCLETTLPYVRQQGEIIIFESIKSVMKAYGWGYRNCASAEKHTLTPEQISLLIRLHIKNVIFAYDSDVDYREGEVRDNIDRLRRVTNVYVISDPDRLLGGAGAKNAPADCGREIWETLYQQKRKVV